MENLPSIKPGADIHNAQRALRAHIYSWIFRLWKQDSENDEVFTTSNGAWVCVREQDSTSKTASKQSWMLSFIIQ